MTIKPPQPKVGPFKVTRDKVLILNQLLLPHEVKWVECQNHNEVCDAIKKMYVRGAPAIAIAAAYGFYLAIWNRINQEKSINLKFLESIKKKLDSARPTAINPARATEKMLGLASALITNKTPKEIKADSVSLLLNLFNKAVDIHQDDALRCYNIGKNTMNHIKKLIPKKSYQILTHCNTGSLATGGIGTALGAIRLLNDENRVSQVYVDETRPYLQGSRLTAFELVKEKIPATLIVDSQAGFLMQKQMIDFVIVGADRITKRGDVANKIGTYMLSVLAKEHKVPFYVVAPKSTFDLTLNKGIEIPIEERDSKEITHVKGIAIAPKIKTLNYSFDITPRENITAIIHENGIY